MNFRLNKFLIFSFTLSLFNILSQSCVTDDEPGNSGLTVGDSLPSFSVTLNDGTKISDKSLEGKVGVIVFFNTSCPDCQEELPVVQQLWEKLHGSSDVEIIAISREEDAGSVSEYWADKGLSIPWSAQSDRKVYSLFASSGIPRIYISDRSGIITSAFSDNPLPSLDDLISAVAIALN